MTWRRLRRDKAAVAGAVVIGVIGGVVVVENVFGLGGAGRTRSRRSTRATCR